MNEHQLSLVFAVVIGGFSLFMLLSLVRQILPSWFVPETKKLHQVIKTQSAIGQSLAGGPDGAKQGGLSETFRKSLKESTRLRKRNGRLGMDKRLRYARWPISKVLFYLFSCCISALVFSLVVSHTNIVIHCMALLSGPVVMRIALMVCVERRTNRFDADYPQFLMSMVGLLKAGMTASGALEVAARGLDHGSLVREEVSLMVERIRLGVLEDRSIGAFGEDILHPEIELFVQALLLSRRMGGNLSESLERLSKQARKRQYFRSSAKAAVGLQRGSLFLIIGLLLGLQGFILIVYPALILKGMQNEVGWQVWQVCFALIVIALFWVRQVTRLKI